jgi:hypothetical protein
MRKILALAISVLPFIGFSASLKPQEIIIIPKKTIKIMQNKAQAKPVEKRVTYKLSAMRIYALLSGEKFATQDGGRVKVDKVCYYVKNQQTGKEELVGCKLLSIQPY